jgi:hypothetical protein
MDFSSNIDLIVRDLTKVCEIIDDLKHYPGVPSFQVEIAKSKCRGAAELIALLKTMKEYEPPLEAGKPIPSGIEDVKPEEPKKIFTEPVTKTASSEIPIHDVSDSISMPPVYDEPGVIEKPAKTEKTASENYTEKVSERPSIADRFSPVSNSLYEQIGSQKGGDDMAVKIKAKPVVSLTEAIGLSDKFLFIGEIFKGDKDAYTQAISKLDNAENYAHARSLVLGLTEDGEESETIKQLLMIVKRKHPSDE